MREVSGEWDAAAGGSAGGGVRHTCVSHRGLHARLVRWQSPAGTRASACVAERGGEDASRSVGSGGPRDERLAARAWDGSQKAQSLRCYSSPSRGSDFRGKE